MRVEGNLRGLKDWKGKGTPKQTSKDEIGRDLRVFRNNNTKRHANSLGDLEKYAPHATVEESDLTLTWIFQSGLLSLNPPFTIIKTGIIGT